MKATVAKTRNHFSRIFDRLNDITHSELEKSAPLGRETKKEDFVAYYANIRKDYRI